MGRDAATFDFALRARHHRAHCRRPTKWQRRRIARSTSKVKEMAPRSLWFVRFARLAIFLLAIAAVRRGAAASPRQWYNDWTYYPQFGYYYSSYYYLPSAVEKSYRQYFCLFYPAHPRYVYYFDPQTHLYLGRLDVKGEAGHQYSALAPKDRKEKLKEIPEDAFPKPGAMPPIPDSKDGEPMQPVKALPKAGSKPAAPTATPK
jgi:hypothetical protein